MKLKYGIAAVALITLAASPGYTQRAHQAGDTQRATKQGSKMMSMPAMTDAHFVEMMSKHHQDGIELAKIEESRGTREEVKSLAAKIREGQERELQELQSAHSAHGSPGAAKPQGTAGHGGHDASMREHHEMMEQMGRQSKNRVENASGTAVDNAFLQEMTKHHEMSLEMISKAKLKDPELQKVAQRIAASQKRELQELKRLQQSR